MDRMLEATARAEDRHFWFRALRRNAGHLLASALAPDSRATIVDCGAGTGRNLDWLARFGRAVGVELSPAGLAAARGRGHRLVRATVAALPLADSSVVAATAFDVLYCLPDDIEQQALAEMWRVLEPNGVAVFHVAALDALRGSHSTLTREVRRYTPSRLRSRLEAAGFVVERLTFTNLPTFPVALASRTLERLTGRAQQASDADLAVPLPPLNTLFDWLLRLEGWWLRRANVPIGSSLLCLARKADRPVRPG
ncbi:MAG TPA: class I SAM-dependent methyltransferase [Vicinamibacterales bacterium]|nr:class I SAM-dependent methyltransferase [Vicinamibacterales bacterium]